MEDVKPTIDPGGNQATSADCQTTYIEQKVFMLSQAYMWESLDSINGTSKESNVFWKDIETLYDTMWSNYNRSKIECLTTDSDDLFVSLPKCKQSLLRQQWSKCLQPDVNKFAGIHFR